MRSRRGYKRTRPEENPHGKTQRQLREWNLKQEAKYSKVKKRHLKDLSVKEIDEIVRAVQVPFLLHKDIAQRFRVSHYLVGKLVNESEDRPEKLVALRGKRELAVREVEVIQ